MKELGSEPVNFRHPALVTSLHVLSVWIICWAYWACSGVVVAATVLVLVLVILVFKVGRVAVVVVVVVVMMGVVRVVVVGGRSC
jgi:hypothetical protein